MQGKRISPARAPRAPRTGSAYRRLEDVVGCKWSVSVLQAIGEGIARPGALERSITGISTKVLSERLRKLTAYGLLEQRRFAELPPRTEYSLTPDGRRLLAIIGQIRDLDLAMAAATGNGVVAASARARRRR